MRLQARYWRLVSEHTHTTATLTNGLTALPSAGTSYAAARAMNRFWEHDGTTLPTLLEPAQDAVRAALATSPSRFALVVHDWCMFNFHTHTRKADRHQRTHPTDLGYELGSALVVDAADGRPLGPMEMRLRTADAVLSTRLRPTEASVDHLDGLSEVLDESRRWSLARTPVHVIDREADSVGHYRTWHARGHRFVVRANQQRRVKWQGKERQLSDVVTSLGREFQVVRDASGEAEVVTIRAGTGVVQVAETAVELHRAARHRVGDRCVRVPGAPIALRRVVTRVVGEAGVLAEWWLLTNLTAGEADAATVGRWYAWRWRIESYHKLLKTAGQNAEEWQQTSGEAFAKRLCVASMACLTVWHLQRDASAEAGRLRRWLVRLSGRAMAHRVESTAPALLAGLEKLLAFEAIDQEELAEMLDLARRLLPQLFPRPRPSPPVHKL